MDTKINMSGKKSPDHGIFPCARKMFRLRRLMLSGLILPLVWFIFSSQIHAMRLHQSFKQIGRVDGGDLALLASEFGRTDCGHTTPCEADFSDDTDVDGSDLASLISEFGETDCC